MPRERPDTPAIRTPRLELVSLSAAVLEASLARDRTTVQALLGVVPAPEWFETRSIGRRLEQIRQDPGVVRWLLRAMVERETGTMVGHVNFHTAPAPEYLEPYAPGGIEIGYTVYPAFRRRGYAREACGAMMQWAAEEAGVRRFVLSIRADNEPSLRIARYYAFRKVATVEDEEDGPEDVYVWEAAA